jgi:hypothetical protein
MLPRALALCVCTLILALGGCASSKDTTRENREKVSTVPWNKPQSWEGKGVLGGMVQ